MKPIETVDKCTTCSTCVAYCPVTKATRAFKGPKLTGPSSERFRLYDETGGGEISEIEALDYCSNCKNCDIACPSGVKISTLNMLARAEYCKRHKPPLRDWVLSHGRMLGRLARRFPGWLVNVGSTNALTRLILDKFGVDARAPMPVFVPRSFTEWMGDHNAMLTASDRSRLTKKAVFFPGCYVNDYDPQTGKDLVFMLEKAGYEVIVPEFECCGLPMVANGFFDDARAAASRNVDTLAALVSSGDVPVLTVCPSCQLMLKQEYADQIKAKNLANSNVGEAMAGIDGVFFTGGEDVSPTLFKVPQKEANMGEEINATRDISDYTLMAYCLSKDVPTLGACRGMQVMSIVSGTGFIQDIPAYYQAKGKTYDDSHRMPADAPDRTMPAMWWASSRLTPGCMTSWVRTSWRTSPPGTTRR